jgi:transposase
MARDKARRIRMADTLELLGDSMEAFRAEKSPVSAAVEPASQKAAKRYRAIDRNQIMIRPVDVEKLVEEDHPVRAIWAMVCQLDLSRFERHVKVVEGGKGRSGSDPRLLAALWIYAYSEGVSSARELSRMCTYEPACEWLTGLEEINHHTLSDFRKCDKEALDNLFVQLLGVLSAEGLTDLKRVMQDGTKIKAQASRNSFHREATLQEHLKLAQEQVAAMGDPDSEELSQRVNKAKQRASRERKQRLEEALKQLEALKKTRKDSEKALRVSESEPTAQVMKQADGGFAPSYNVQICTDASNKIILAAQTTQAQTDSDQLEKGIDAIVANTGQQPAQMVTDAAYTNNSNVEMAAERGIDQIGPVTENKPKVSMQKRGIPPNFYPDQFRYNEDTNTFTCPAEKTLTFKRAYQRSKSETEHHYRAERADCANCPFRNQCCPKRSPREIVRTEVSEVVKQFRAKMQTPEAKQIYRTRAEVAEFPNAWIKEKIGLRKFRLRGLVKAGMEILWACLSYNIRQWIRLSWMPKFAAAGIRKGENNGTHRRKGDLGLIQADCGRQIRLIPLSLNNPRRSEMTTSHL